MAIAILLFILFLGCFATLFASGLWSNTLTLVNVLTAGLLAMNYFEPLADFLEKQDSSLSYAYDFVSIWLIFGISMVVLRWATDSMSQVKVRFFLPVEKVGGILMAIWVSWVVVCFTTVTLHTAPLARNFLGGSFQPEPDSKMVFGLGPDWTWLGWVHRESKGSLCRLGALAPFDANGDFILRYSERRAQFESQLSFLKEKSAAPTPSTPAISLGK